MGLCRWLRGIFRSSRDLQTPTLPTGAIPPWLPIAEAEFGVTEYPGPKNNPRIIEYHAACDIHLTQDADSWCSAFACWTMEKAGFKSPRKANARSWLKWGKELKHPIKGCIVVLWRVSPSSWEGHVGFYVREDTSYVYLIGGNQSDMVKIAAYPKNRILSYRWPT